MFIGSVFTMYLQAEDGPKLYKKLLRAILGWLLKKSNRGTIVVDRVLIGNRIKKHRENLFILKTKGLFFNI